MSDFLDTDITFLKGMGEKRASLFSKEIGVATFRDLLYYFPFRHVDRSKLYSISDLRGEDLPSVQIKGRFISFRTEGEGVRKRLIGVFSDGHKFMETVWFAKFNHIPSQYSPRDEVIIFGKPGYYQGVYSIVHPEIEKYDPNQPPGGFRGIYSLTETFRKKGGSIKLLQTLVKNLISHPRFGEIKECLPQSVMKRYHLMPLKDALVQMHFPENAMLLQKAIERMKFEELFFVEMHILRFSMERGNEIQGFSFRRVGESFNSFYKEVLPFELTDAQKRVIREIREDMKTGKQMNRLLQGDVGSGKTLVAFMTMLLAKDNGYQSALMAPTEILASQHFKTLKEWASPIDVRVELLTGSTRQSERKKLHEDLQSGKIDILVGTHALIEDNVVFSRLGLAIIDEQHRFGVAQRGKLWQKNLSAPHVLVLTATPIPRTLAMTVYGDLEVSVIDSLPPGRKPVTTLLRYDSSRIEVDRLIFSELKQGRQIYIVYPLIQENEKLDLKSLEEGFERTQEIFKDYRVCFVHGKMKPEEKEYQMNLFVKGEARIMVATTVIEVGVNVPNATVMVIENAERFGLSQLHQLRGRVGRGADRSYCVLMTKQKSSGETRKRLGIMTETSDGFLISEADMKIRGPGDMEGTQQSGIAFNLKIANLARDGQIISLARDAAKRVLKNNVSLVTNTENVNAGETETEFILSTGELNIITQEMLRRFGKKTDWSRIS